MRSLEGSDLARIYEARFAGNAEQRVRVWEILAQFFSQWVKPSDVVLDLGAGYCEFVNAVQAATKYAMDLNPDTKALAGSGVTVIEQNSSEPWPLSDGSLDVIFTSNFLEHLADKESVQKTVGQAFRCLRPGGTFVALGPNIKYLPGAYWDFFDHYVPLTDSSLSELLTSRGFTIEKKIARFLPYTMSGGSRFPTWTLSVYLRMPPVWRVFGKQFLIVAKKR